LRVEAADGIGAEGNSTRMTHHFSATFMQRRATKKRGTIGGKAATKTANLVAEKDGNHGKREGFET